jgi:hypothetical protein
MPWTAGDAKKHKKGLTPEQAAKWAKIANKVLADCKKSGGKDCEGKAIRIANSKFGEGDMIVEKRKIPNNALFFKEPGQFEFKDSDGETKHFSMLAYSGKVIKGHWLWGDLAIDVLGMSFPRRAFPILEEHLRDYKIGFSKKKPSVENNCIEIEDAALLNNEKALEFYNNAKEGFPYEASLSVRPSVIEELGEGEKAEVNGYFLKGPATIFRKGIVREASVCTFGYDNKSSVSVFNDTQEKELDLEVFRSYDNSIEAQSGSTNPLSRTVDGPESFGETSEGTDTNIVEGGKQTMDLEKLKKEYPELVKSIEDAATSALREELAEKNRKITILEDKNEQLSDANKANTDRIAKLEKSETIRTEKELKVSADKLFNEAVTESTIPERLYPKIRAQIDHGKFVEDGKLNEERFSEAVKAEIESWETELSEAYSSESAVQGMSRARGKGNSKEEETETLVNRMVGYVIPEEERQAA